MHRRNAPGRAPVSLPHSLVIAAGLLGAGASSLAQEPAAETSLAPIAVTASQREQAVRAAPASVTVIERKEIESRPESTVMDLLRSVEGVGIVGANPNDQDISLRGMPGEYTLILVDGRRQNTRETMNRGSGGVQSHLLPPLAAIERIEVIRGPMSSLYGADAMGGAVNIITRAQPARWGASLAAHAVQQAHHELGDSRGMAFWLGGPLVDERLSLRIFGATNRRGEDGVYFPLNATSGAHGQRDENVGLQFSARLTPGQNLSFHLGHESLSYLLTPGRSIADATTPATILRSGHSRESWGLTHEGRGNWGRSFLSLYGETGTQTQWLPAGRSPVEPELRNGALEGRVILPWAKDANTLTLGMQYIRQSLGGVARQAVVAGLAANPDTIQRDSWALSAENDFAIGRDFVLTAGARLDHDAAYGSQVSPRLYGVYTLDENWTLRGGVARGFKAPTLRQSAAGYCMTTGGGGAAGAVAGTLCGNQDLRPETSVNGEIGLRRDSGGNFASLTVFHNQFKNRVASYDTGVADPRVRGRNIYVYDNMARADITGLELGAGTRLAKDWRLSGSYTLTDSRRRGGESAFNGDSLAGYPLDKTPRNQAHWRLEWQALSRLTLQAAAHYIGKQYWAAFRNSALGVREREASTTWDLGARGALAPGVDLKFTVMNATDERIDVDTRARTQGLQGNWMLDEGRRYALTLLARF
ncbi:TonB-dependent receptor [Verminephrobacter aporrectodeae subsp. tuberculatae]|uniref:TonB-dependent receptor n=1 Tax=Verminephrobacter aporrectodeae subsp. tuberculatae TaxID=1110392 RepID=A0ABT3KTA7_9BURK|nr:TonB-dependent receptor [Verminephrobacter aporrectodeae]MCW5321035.1 TonB-dependent receptor [Verminephrobacter aporrectodeae subsp. tuberculatae]MCW8199542.1 TonB-dependent receptor [Verminephrobacter aporrectodeae subsp. tuberculatae]